MNVLIFGAGKAGRFLYDEIKVNTKDIHVAGFIDNFLEGDYERIHIWKPQEILPRKELYQAVFIAAGAQKTVKTAVDTITGHGMYEIYMLHDICGKNRISPFDGGGYMIPYRLRKIRFSEEKPTLPYFEVPVTDACNLNCKGCLFACNSDASGGMIPAGQIKRDALRMRELFYDIPWIRILGGEPLMHPDIAEILRFYRDIFMDSEIDLCTNGLLIPKMPEDFFEVLVENRITIHISGYRPVYNMLDKIDGRLKSYGLDYTILKREEFSKYYTLEWGGHTEENFKSCIASECKELYNGRLMRCSGVIAFEKLNEQFGTSYEVAEDEDWFDIHKTDVDAWALKRKIDCASHTCGYCDIARTEEYAWSHSKKAELSDYVLGER